MSSAIATHSPRVRKPRPPRSYAPGFGLAALAGVGCSEQPCPGCADHPLTECAGCGGPVARVLPAGDHSLPLCLRCYGIVRESRAEQRAANRKRGAA